ncbi:unnamed protein product [Tenebrio molitor]|nr:unnamed protein product [Tenebrio molitor]
MTGENIWIALKTFIFSNVFGLICFLVKNLTGLIIISFCRLYIFFSPSTMG